jgi:predicted RNase H-like HicB family nuclease
MSDAGVEVEKMNLRTKEAVDVGLEALYEEAKQWPEAIEAFERFRDVVKRLEAGGSGQQIAGNS